MIKRRLSLKQRILLTIAALLAITMAGGGFTIWYASWMDSLITSVTSSDIRAVEVAAELQTELAQQKGFVTYFFLDSDEAWLQQLEKHNGRFDLWLSRARELSENPASRNVISRIESSYLRYIAGRDQVVELYRRGEMEAGKLLHRQVREQYGRTLELCEELKAIHRKNIEEAQASSRDRVRIMNTAALAIMPVAFTLGIILAMTLMRQVLMPLRQLALTPEKGGDRGNDRLLDKPTENGPVDEVEAIGIFVRDLIENVDRTQMKLAQSQVHLIQTEKLALVGKMAAGVAHSVRNPLTSVKMRLFSLKRSLELNAVQQEDFEVISAEIRHIDTILQNFLEFSRPPKLKMQVVSPSDVVDMALQLMRHRLESYRVEVVLRRLDRLPPALLDPEQIKELLVNLMVNACEAMVDGGRITIREEQDIDETLGRVEIIRLSDNGPGVPQEVADKVFEPFFSSKEEGTGLGLSIARRIIEEHGGRITLSPGSDGRGATFTIMLPYRGEEQS